MVSDSPEEDRHISTMEKNMILESLQDDQTSHLVSMRIMSALLIMLQILKTSRISLVVNRPSSTKCFKVLCYEVLLYVSK